MHEYRKRGPNDHTKTNTNKNKKRMIVKPKKVKKSRFYCNVSVHHTRCALAIVTIEQCYAYEKKVKCFMGSKRERKMRI